MKRSTIQTLVEELDRSRKQARIWEEAKTFLERIQRSYSSDRTSGQILRLADGRMVEEKYFLEVLTDIDVIIAEIYGQIESIERVEVPRG